MCHGARHGGIFLGHEARVLRDELNTFAFFVKGNGRLPAVAVCIKSAFAQAGFAGQRQHVHLVELLGLDFQQDFVFRFVEGKKPFDDLSLLHDVRKGFLLRRLRLLIRSTWLLLGVGFLLRRRLLLFSIFFSWRYLP